MDLFQGSLRHFFAIVFLQCFAKSFRICHTFPGFFPILSLTKVDHDDIQALFDTIWRIIKSLKLYDVAFIHVNILCTYTACLKSVAQLINFSLNLFFHSLIILELGLQILLRLVFHRKFLLLNWCPRDLYLFLCRRLWHHLRICWKKVVYYWLWNVCLFCLLVKLCSLNLRS